MQLKLESVRTERAALHRRGAIERSGPIKITNKMLVAIKLHFDSFFFTINKCDKTHSSSSSSH